MKVILLKDIPNLGQEGEVQEVAEGYFRNFLYPRKLAMIATEKLIAEAARKAETKQKSVEADLQRIKKVQKELQGLSFEIKASADEKGTLYRAVSAEDVAAKLSARGGSAFGGKEKGFDLKPEQIEFAEPIKKIGDYEVKIKLGQGIEAIIKVYVNR